MRRRQCDHWLDDYLKWTEDSESPVLYHKWAGLVTVAAALQRRCWLSWDKIIFPNLYVVLIGPSGGRKADPINRCRHLLESLSIPMLGHFTTKEAIVRDMKEYEVNGVSEGMISSESPVACVTAEFYVLMGEHDTQLASFLTDWYDSSDSWSYRTKTQGDLNISGVCLTLFSASDPSWLNKIFSPTMLKGGFVSRIIFPVQEGTDRIIADPTEVVRDRGLERRLLSDLEAVKSMKGSFTLDADTKEIYKEWYTRERKLQNAGKHPLQSYSDGYVSRRPTTLLKVCMIVSAMRDNSRRIMPEDFRRTLELLEEVEVDMPSILKGLGTTKYGVETSMVLDYVKRHGKATQRDIMTDLSNYIDAYNFEIVRNNLVAAGQVTNDRVKGQITLTFIGDKGS